MTATVAEPPTHRNEVLLLGRLSAAPEVRTLPSGDEITVWRLVVGRDALVVGRPTQDTVDCVAWSARVRRCAASWQADDVVEVEGSLRRRFWRAGPTLASRYEVEVVRGRRVTKAVTRRRTPE
jgi:single-strand DNA-binding protein